MWTKLLMTLPQPHNFSLQSQFTSRLLHSAVHLMLIGFVFSLTTYICRLPRLSHLALPSRGEFWHKWGDRGLAHLFLGSTLLHLIHIVGYDYLRVVVLPIILFFQFGGSEAIITALSDEFPKIGRNREIFVACLFTVYFLVGLASCSQGGFYFFHLLDRYAAGYSMLFAVFFEAITVSWIYGQFHFFKQQ